MKLSPTIIQHLHKYSSFQSEQKVSTKTENPIERMQEVQEEWLSGGGEQFNLKALQRLHQQAIDASAGSSSFLPPEEIEKNVRETAVIGWVEYTNHLPQNDVIKAADQYFKKIQVIDNHTQLEEYVYDQDLSDGYFCYIGHGTTELFTAALKSIKKHSDDIVIVTDPTYGLFVPPLLHDNKGVEILKLNKEDDYKPNANRLVELITSTNVRLEEQYFIEVKIVSAFLTAFFQIHETVLPMQAKRSLSMQCESLKEILELPNLNHTKIDQATNSFNQALNSCLENIPSSDASLWQRKLMLPFCPRVRGYFHINPQMPLGIICNQKEINKIAETLNHFPDVTVIDDLTYYDLCFDNKVKPGTFAQSILKKKTLTLYSASKQFALAGTRTGIALGPQNLIQPIAKHSFNTVNTPSVFSSEVAFQIFKMNPKTREKYLNDTTSEYAFRRDFSISLLQGIEQVDNEEHHEKIKKTLSGLKINLGEQATLLKGIEGLTFPVIPQAGFFLLIDFTHYQNQYLGTTKLSTSRDFRNAFYSLTDLNTVPGEIMLHFDKPILRFSFSLSPKDILESVYRFKNVLSLCRAEPLLALDNQTDLEEKAKMGSGSFKVVADAKASTIKQASSQAAGKKTPSSFTRSLLPAFHQHKKEQKEVSSKAKQQTATRPRGKRKITPNKRYANGEYQ